jgi:lipoprotein-anchoring transpeptidase ErfK/SrfK
MRVRKLVIGAAIAAIGVLSACSSQPSNVDLAAGQGNLPVTTTTPPSSPTTTTESSTSTPSSTTTESSTTTKTTPKTTPKKTTTPKPKPQPSTEAPCSTAAKACIKLSTNQSWLMENGKVIAGPVPITHGRKGYLTPTGSFKVSFKNKNHKSSIFNNAPMNNSVFFNGGIAFHEGSLREKSHGCIHLAKAASLQWFNSLSVGDVVEVVR